MVDILTGRTRHGMIKRKERILRYGKWGRETFPALVAMTLGWSPMVMAIYWRDETLQYFREIFGTQVDETSSHVQEVLLIFNIASLCYLVFISTYLLIRMVLPLAYDRMHRAQMKRIWRESAKAHYRSLGFRRPSTGRWATIALVMISFGVMLGATYVYGSITDIFNWKWAEDPRDFQQNTWTQIIITGILFVVLAPALEEVIFRGMLFRGLFFGGRVVGLFGLFVWGRRVLSLANIHVKGLGTGLIGTTLVLVISSVLFGILHPPGYMVITSFMGLVFGVLRLTTGSLWPCIALHALWNGMAFMVIQFGTN